ncbi:hypothetical protein Tco_0201754 [Tanacetum coccineum]
MYSCELCGNDSHYGYDCPPRFSLAANIRTQSPEPTQRFNPIYYDDDDDEENSIHLSEMPQILWYIAIAPVLPTMKPEDSFIMGNGELSTIPEKESDEFIKSSVEDLVPIPSESKSSVRFESLDIILCEVSKAWSPKSVSAGMCREEDRCMGQSYHKNHNSRSETQSLERKLELVEQLIEHVEQLIEHADIPVKLG